MNQNQTRTYKRSECAVFSKTKEAFGGLSNMAAGFPLRVNGIRILTSEALYQACRFPHRPEVQRLIIGEASPMTAKMKSKPYRQDSRSDWDRVRVRIMRWCLRVKLAQNWNEFSRLLLVTRDQPIVEESRKDDFWGAKVVDEETLVGMNVLGRLLMELREEVKQGDRERLSRVEPLDIPDFQLYGDPISAIEAHPARSEAVSRPYKVSDSAMATYGDQVPADPALTQAVQVPLFDSERPKEPNKETYTGLFSGLKTYSEYRDSWSLWIGSIPAHWDIRKLRTLVRSRNDRNRPDLPLLSVAREKGVFVRSLTGEDENRNVIPQDLSNYKVARAGNLVINKMKAWQGSMGISPCDGIVSPAYFVFDFEMHNRPYGQMLVRSKPYVAHFAQVSDGVRIGQWDLSISGMREIPMLLPPPDEQAAIVRFLDYANRRIERAFRAKRKVIALLNEQKQAIIHRAVTRGLDPNVTLKPSGISWLGDTPKHWDVLRSKYVFREVDERSATGGEELLSVSHITGVTPRSEKNITMFKAASYVGHKVCRPGDLVINTMWAWMAALGVSKHTGIISPAYAVYRPRNPNRLHGEYIDYLLRTKPYVSEYICRSTGIRSSRLRLYPEQFFKIPILLPPIKEQIDMIAKIAAETAELTIAINRTEREIEFLREYRTRMIADVVTGKLDVREAARNLPVEIEEAEVALEAEEIEDEAMEELMGVEIADE